MRFSQGGRPIFCIGPVSIFTSFATSAADKCRRIICLIALLVLAGATGQVRAGVKDLFNGELVRYALDARMAQQRVMQALFRAVAAKRPGKGLIHHADRGSQCCPPVYQRLLRQFGMQTSMSPQGKLLRQRTDGKLPGFPEDRTGASPPLRY